MQALNPFDMMKLLELRNMLIASEMVCRAALAREECRGAHYRNDFPNQNDEKWFKNIIITNNNDNMKLKFQMVKSEK
jgi:succinate dehydrogenase/fumarate reductase flavoprotein subunit